YTHRRGQAQTGDKVARHKGPTPRDHATPVTPPSMQQLRQRQVPCHDAPAPLAHPRNRAMAGRYPEFVAERSVITAALS
ncbi:MAG: hypothetical protein ACK5YO_10890, partial [Planctomyces sp.]